MANDEYVPPADEADRLASHLRTLLGIARIRQGVPIASVVAKTLEREASRLNPLPPGWVWMALQDSETPEVYRVVKVCLN